MFVKQCKLGCVSVVVLFVWWVLIQHSAAFYCHIYKEQLIPTLGILCLDVFHLLKYNKRLTSVGVEDIFFPWKHAYLSKFFAALTLVQSSKGTRVIHVAYDLPLRTGSDRANLNGTSLQIGTVPNSHLNQSSYFCTNILYVFHLRWKDKNHQDFFSLSLYYFTFRNLIWTNVWFHFTVSVWLGFMAFLFPQYSFNLLVFPQPVYISAKLEVDVGNNLRIVLHILIHFPHLMFLSSYVLASQWIWGVCFFEE